MIPISYYDHTSENHHYPNPGGLDPNPIQMDLTHSCQQGNCNSIEKQETLVYFGDNNSFSMPLSRYMKLKKRAIKAIQNNKIFSVHGDGAYVRKILEERGWIEKISPTRLNISKKMPGKIERVLLSNLVVHAKPDLIWDQKEDWGTKSKNRFKKEDTTYNRIQISYLWTTKLGLCAALQKQYWSYIEDVAEVNSPRTYTCIDKADIDNFIGDFKLTACTSLLKWLLSMVENERIVFSENGTIAVNIIVFAINRCKEYLFRKQHKDIDRYSFPRITNGQWNTFLKNYYILIARESTFKPDNDNKVPLFMGYAKILLTEIHKYRPQLSCEGCHNIWIMKPAHSSRGRGIELASNLGVLSEVLDKRKYVVQKYIEEPLLIYDTKFDIRQYYLVTNTYPLEVWMYKDSYLKFCSQEYNIKNYHESVHLTNNAVQRKYTNCNNRHPKLPKCNMWSSETFKEYLKEIELEKVWDTIVYPGMKKSIVGVMATCQDSIPFSFKNCFELYGCDFILDNNYNPWLIEINSCPDMNPTTPVTSVICQAVISDVLKVVIDKKHNTKETVGKFECIYRPQYFSRPCKTFLEVRGHKLPTGYFYRGGIPTDTSNSPSITTQPDIAAMLKMLKEKYQTDIMQEPVVQYPSPPVLSPMESDYESSESDEEVHKIATLITELLDGLIDCIPIKKVVRKPMSDITCMESGRFKLVLDYTSESNLEKKILHSVPTLAPTSDHIQFVNDDLVPAKPKLRIISPNGKIENVSRGEVRTAKNDVKILMKLKPSAYSRRRSTQ